jgi:putative hydrolase of the HAD superfamily
MDGALDRELMKRIADRALPLSPIATGIAPRLAPMTGIRAVLFDVYGTLLASGAGDIGVEVAGSDVEPFADALEASGLDRPSRDAAAAGALRYREAIARRHAEGRGQGVDHPEVDIRDVWREVLEGMKVRHGADDVARVAVEFECRVNPVWPMPGAADTLTALHERGILLGIISNAQFYTPLVLRSLLGEFSKLGFRADLCLWSYEAGVAKPSRSLLEEGLTRARAACGAEPQEVLYVGNDDVKDIAPARATGFRAAQFAGDRRSYRCTGAAVPDAVITRLGHLLELIR